MATNQKDDSSKGKQGMASMDPAKQREIASQGGRASHSGSGSSQQQQSSDDESQQTSSGGGRSDGGSSASGSSTGTQGGSPEQHAEAGRQSHKKSK